MPKVTTTRESAKTIPQEQLALWAFASNTDTAGTVYDVSGNGRDLTVATSQPALQADVVAGSKAVYFDGTNNALEMNSAITIKHLFLVVKIDEATFGGNRGLFGSTTQNVLIGTNAGTKFQDNGLGGNFEYRKNDVFFADNDAQAPMNKWAIIECIFPSGLSLANLRIGNLGVGFKGWFAEIIAYTSVRGTLKRLEIYQDLAKAYHIWRMLSDGTPIFPFPNNHDSPFRFSPYVIRSESLPNGKFKERRPPNSAMLREFDMSYSEVRRQNEVDAVEQFEIDNYGINNIALINNSFCPPRQFVGRILDPIEKAPGQIMNVWGYGKKFRQMVEGYTKISILDDEVVDTTAPFMPGNPSHISHTHNSAVISFGASSDPESGISNYQWTSNNGTTWNNFASYSGSGTITGNISGLTPSTAYTIKVRAVNGSGLVSAMTTGSANFTTDSASIVSPDQFANILAAWRAQSLTASNNDPIGTWASYGGSHTLSQSVNGERPLYKTNVRNSKPGLLFDNTDDGMVSDLTISSGSYSVWVLFNRVTSTSGASRAVHGTSNWLIGVYTGNVSNYSGSFLNMSGAAVNTFYLALVTWDGTTRRFYVNNSEVANSTTHGYPGQLNLGGENGFGELADGNIIEVGATSNALDATERTQLYDYMVNQYGSL